MSDIQFFHNWSSKVERNFKPIFKDLKNRKDAIGILEIGVFEGRTTRLFLDNMNENPNSYYVGIDPWNVDVNMGSKWQSEEGRKKMSEVREHAFAVEEEYPNRDIEFYQMQSTGALIDIHRSLQDKADRRVFDLIYVDGCHEPLGIIKDFALTWDLLRINGYIVFDDYVRRPRFDKVVQTVDRLVEAVNHDELLMEVVFGKNKPCGQIGFRKVKEAKAG